MSSSDPVIELLLRWEEQRRGGLNPTPEELCPGEPALQETLRRRIRERERFRPLWTQGEGTEIRPLSPSPSPLQPPPALAETCPVVAGYEIVGTLGKGGMGIVYKARQTKLGRLVALKMVLSEGAASPVERSRFRREAEATARLQHPNIVQIYQLGEHDGCPYFVLELVEGGSLAERLRGTPLMVRSAAELVLLLARAVQHAHERGVLHRDLKPANVLLGADGAPKIADFGVARRLDLDQGQTRTGAIVGTPSYMAPEQAEGQVHDLGPATDVYALGAILYECVTGRPPFKAPSVLETLEQVRTHDPARPTALQPGLPRDLETICLKCLQKDPRHRYRSARELADDLQRFLDGEPISARGQTLLEQLTRTISHTSADARFRSWGNLMLRVAPAPALVQVLLWLLFRDWPAYPVLCLLMILLGASTAISVMVWQSPRMLREVPHPFRQDVRSVMLGCLAGFFAVSIIVALTRPGHDLSEFFQVFPLCIIVLAVCVFSMGGKLGLFYAATLFYFALALLAAWVPGIGPLLLGMTISTHLLSTGLHIRLRTE
jgi:serine/threonine-protein kinase